MGTQTLPFKKEFKATQTPEQLAELKVKKAEYMRRVKSETDGGKNISDPLLCDIACKLVVLREILRRENETDDKRRVITYNETMKRACETLRVEKIDEKIFQSAWVVIWAYNMYGINEALALFKRAEEDVATSDEEDNDVSTEDVITDTDILP